MNRDASRATHHRPAGLPAPMLITALVAVIAMSPGTALAQNNRAPIPNPQAADPRSEEGERSPAQKELDEKLQICRGC